MTLYAYEESFSLILTDATNVKMHDYMCKARFSFYVRVLVSRVALNPFSNIYVI